eukprot:1014720-Lingulodinium_polyedra.AAC.1
MSVLDATSSGSVISSMSAVEGQEETTEMGQEVFLLSLLVGASAKGTCASPSSVSTGCTASTDH